MKCHHIRLKDNTSCGSTDHIEDGGLVDERSGEEGD